MAGRERRGMLVMNCKCNFDGIDKDKVLEFQAEFRFRISSHKKELLDYGGIDWYSMILAHALAFGFAVEPAHKIARHILYHTNLA